MVLMSSNVRSPFRRAKSIVCTPFRTETGGLVPSDTVKPVISTWKETTLGRGASVPVTNTLPDWVRGGVVVIEPPPPPLRVSRSAKTPIPLIHVREFMSCSFRSSSTSRCLELGGHPIDQLHLAQPLPS